MSKQRVSLRGRVAIPAIKLGTLLGGVKTYVESDDYFRDEALIADIRKAKALVVEILQAVGEEPINYRGGERE